MSFIVPIQAVLAVLIVLGILSQHRAAGLTSGSGGNNTIVQRRGAEKVMYQGTIVLSVVFFLLTILDWFI